MTTNLKQTLFPPVIRGGWQLSEGHGGYLDGRSPEDMQRFYEAGIRTIDCGDIYTGVEEAIGNYCVWYQTQFGQQPNLRVHTKYVPDLDKLAQLSLRDVEMVIDRSLERLHVEQLDLVQFHWWDFEVPRYVEVALYLAELQSKGKIGLIGATNFDEQHLAEIVAAGVKVASNQVQYSLLDDRPRHGLVDYCAEQAIQLLCYGTVAGGFLSERWIGQPEPSEFENRSLVKYKLIIDDIGGWDVFQRLLVCLQKVAIRCGVSVSSIASRYVLDLPQVASVIVGAKDSRHLASMKEIGCLLLTDEDRREIEEVRAQLQRLSGKVYELERDREGKHGRIMKYNLNKK